MPVFFLNSFNSYRAAQYFVITLKIFVQKHGCICFKFDLVMFTYSVTLQCTSEGKFVVVVSRDATQPPLSLDSINLAEAGPSCSPSGTTSAFAIYEFPVSSCGTTMKVSVYPTWHSFISDQAYIKGLSALFCTLFHQDNNVFVF